MEIVKLSSYHSDSRIPIDRYIGSGEITTRFPGDERIAGALADNCETKLLRRVFWKFGFAVAERWT
jgi:hypothetical protein